MALNGYTWLYMAIHGNRWWYMVIHGNTWLYMAIHGNTWLYVVIHGNTWLYMAKRGNTWHYMGIHGYTWHYIAIHDIIWVYMALHGYTWLYMALHCYTWHYMAIHGITWLFWYISWYTLITLLKVPTKIRAALYNITADPNESQDLRRTYPDVVRTLSRRIRYYRRGEVPSGKQSSDPEARKLARKNGYWGPWINWDLKSEKNASLFTDKIYCRQG